MDIKIWEVAQTIEIDLSDYYFISLTKLYSLRILELIEEIKIFHNKYAYILHK